MARYKFKTDLSAKGIQNLINELNHYRDVILPSKEDAFIEALARKGIKVAYEHMVGEFDGKVTFTYEYVRQGEGQLVGSDVQKVFRQWYYPKPNVGRVKDSYYISPILMSEFGAGKYAPSEWRGSLGENGKKDVWGWYDENGELHLSTEDPSIIPTHPMHNAFLEMSEVASQVAQEVFTYG